MPFKIQKQFYIIIGVVFFIALIGGASLLNSAKPVAKPTPTPIPQVTPTPGPPPTISFTVKAAIGVHTITITNQNTGSKIVLTAAELPATYNVKYGDTVSFKVTAASGYIFNAWVFGDATFQSQNPYTTKVVYAFIMEARFLMTDVP